MRKDIRRFAMCFLLMTGCAANEQEAAAPDPELGSNQASVIYGADDRREAFAITDAETRRDLDGVVAVFAAGDVTNNGDGTSNLRTQNFGTRLNLCTTEPFRSQPVGANCTGFLISPDLIATAGHCLDAGDFQNWRFVFGFQMTNATTTRTRIGNGEIYRGVELVGRQRVDSGADWAVVRLDRPVTNHNFRPLRRAGTIANNAAVHVIGHPAGLPVKIAGGANVRTNTNGAFFVANLDTYHGNSGSPVFNSVTHEIEGILVRGDDDFVAQGRCNVSKRCADNACRGEDVTRATELQGLLSPAAVGVAFQANTGNLWTTGAAGTADLGLGMMAGTSPSITALSGGGYQIAFQANTGNLWTTGAAGTADLGLGMRAGTSPSISALGGGYQVAFQANTGNLWTTGAAGTADLGLGMMVGTSPSITALSAGGYQIAFQANTTRLWYTGSAGTADTGLGMMANTSPDISVRPGGFDIVFQANTGSLWLAGTARVGDLGLGMVGSTNPSGN